MAYESSVVFQRTFDLFENVKLECALTRDDDLEENQIEIEVKIYKPDTKPMPNINPTSTGKIKVSYADVLANYNNAEEKFDPDFISTVLSELNAEIATKYFQLKPEIKNSIEKILKEYIPKALTNSETTT